LELIMMGGGTLRFGGMKVVEPGLAAVSGGGGCVKTIFLKRGAISFDPVSG
jgi:hypothetical protein